MTDPRRLITALAGPQKHKYNAELKSGLAKLVANRHRGVCGECGELRIVIATATRLRKIDDEVVMDAFADACDFDDAKARELIPSEGKTLCATWTYVHHMWPNLQGLPRMCEKADVYVQLIYSGISLPAARYWLFSHHPELAAHYCDCDDDCDEAQQAMEALDEYAQLLTS